MRSSPISRSTSMSFWSAALESTTAASLATAAAFGQIGRPGSDGLRNGQRDEAECDQIDRNDGQPSARGRRYPHAIDETESRDRRPDEPMPPPQLESLVEQRAREQPEHHDIARR